jgi:hypothetical protein
MSNRIGHNKGPEFGQRVEECVSMLRLVRAGVTLSYPEMEKITGRPMTGGDQYLQRALKLLQREGIAFETIYSTGYRRLDDSGAITHKVVGFSRRSRRAAKRGLKLSAAVPERNLPGTVKMTKWALETSLQFAASKMHGNSIRATAKKKSLFEEERERIAEAHREKFAAE